MLIMLFRFEIRIFRDGGIIMSYILTKLEKVELLVEHLGESIIITTVKLQL